LSALIGIEDFWLAIAAESVLKGLHTAGYWCLVPVVGNGFGGQALQLPQNPFWGF
jgi:hypothetical protein